jgi:hypothetical protein
MLMARPRQASAQLKQRMQLSRKATRAVSPLPFGAGLDTFAAFAAESLPYLYDYLVVFLIHGLIVNAFL